MDAGDTFRPADPKVDIRLGVVIPEPATDPDRVLIVSLTTNKPYKDQACILKIGDHPFIRHDTCVAYDLAKVVSLSQLEALSDSGMLIPDEPVSPQVLQRVRAAIWDSKQIAQEHVDLMNGQGLLP
ncbi:MAG: hypothetical protein ACP5XB_14035 [Isosphaeraceae bacterium]